jgi:hypothetical protein
MVPDMVHKGQGSARTFALSHFRSGGPTDLAAASRLRWRAVPRPRLLRYTRQRTKNAAHHKLCARWWYSTPALSWGKQPAVSVRCSGLLAAQSHTPWRPTNCKSVIMSTDPSSRRRIMGSTGDTNRLISSSPRGRLGAAGLADQPKRSRLGKDGGSAG